MGRLNRDWVAGVMLVVVGLLLLGERLSPDLVPFLPLALGLLLLLVFLLSRSVGALVNGSVTVGIGVGILVVKGGNPDFGAAGFIVSVAGGFYLAWLLGLIFGIPSVRWWPIVPGSVLLAIGAIVYTAKMGDPLLRFAVDWWPALLVLMGGYLLLHARLRSRSRADEETSTVPAGVRGGTATSSSRSGRPPDDEHGEGPGRLGTGDDRPSMRGAHGGTAVVRPLSEDDRPGAIRPISDAAGGHLGGDRPGGNLEQN